MIYEVQIGDRTRRVEVRRSNGDWEVAVDGAPLAAEVAAANERTLSILVEGRSYQFVWERRRNGEIWLAGAGREAVAEVRDPRRALAQRRFEQSGRARLTAPMSGKVVRLLAAPGDKVEAGQGLVVLEAMKMQNEVRSPKTGTLVNLAVAAGATVATGELLADVE